MTELGRLQRIDIREVFRSEPGDFTPWVCSGEGLHLLSQAIAIELELVEAESSVGSYRLDILAKRKGTEELVVIENQYWQTDHSHLGQLLTYAAGVGADGSGARTIVWISESFTEPHRAALDWLNKCTEPGIRSFGIEVQFLRIGDSAPAPLFSVVSRPNAWQKQLSQETSKTSDTYEMYREFWTGFYSFCGEQTTLDIAATPPPRHWIEAAVCAPGLGVNLTASKRDGKLECQLWIGSSKSKQAFAALKERRATIEDQLGIQVQFDEMVGRAPCKIYEVYPADVTNREQWPALYAWLKERGELYFKVFNPLIAELKLA